MWLPPGFPDRRVFEGVLGAVDGVGAAEGEELRDPGEQVDGVLWAICVQGGEVLQQFSVEGGVHVIEGLARSHAGYDLVVGIHHITEATRREVKVCVDDGLGAGIDADKA